MSLLLSPLQVGSVEVRNRIVFTAHGSFLEFYARARRADRYVRYEERRARGGVGLIFLQTMHVHPSSHATGHYPYEPDDLRPKLALMADALHAARRAASSSSSTTSARSSAPTAARTCSRCGASPD